MQGCQTYVQSYRTQVLNGTTKEVEDGFGYFPRLFINLFNLFIPRL